MELFDRSCDLPPPEQATLLGQLSHDDPELGRALAKLLHHDRAPLDALDAGALQLKTLAHDVDLLPGLPDLELLSILAEGGMGRVLLARQCSLQREVAVKMVRPEAASAWGVDGLLAEALLTGALEHPNIVPVHLLERDPHGLPVLVMKRVEGVSWAALIDPKAPDLGAARPRRRPAGRAPADPDQRVQRATLRAQPRRHPPRHQARQRNGGLVR
jgi:hypothetical protein